MESTVNKALWLLNIMTASFSSKCPVQCVYTLKQSRCNKSPCEKNMFIDKRRGGKIPGVSIHPFIRHTELQPIFTFPLPVLWFSSPFPKRINIWTNLNERVRNEWLMWVSGLVKYWSQHETWLIYSGAVEPCGRAPPPLSCSYRWEMEKEEKERPLRTHFHVKTLSMLLLNFYTAAESINNFHPEDPPAHFAYGHKKWHDKTYFLSREREREFADDPRKMFKHAENNICGGQSVHK